MGRVLEDGHCRDKDGACGVKEVEVDAVEGLAEEAAEGDWRVVVLIIVF